MSMEPHVLQSEQLVPRPRDEVFAFFARPENLGVITPPWLGFRILTPSPVPMERGALVDYVIRLGPLPLRWRTLITRHDPPRAFVDEQLQGPYSFWHHTHTFEEVDGGTLIRDRVLYVVPFGALGRVLERVLIRRQLRAIFAHRQRVISRLFDNKPPGD
jgi:ligand-binding SRPBCC domain-containing protein